MHDCMLSCNFLQKKYKSAILSSITRILQTKTIDKKKTERESYELVQHSTHSREYTLFGAMWPLVLKVTVS
jgi:hypothetical protein